MTMWGLSPCTATFKSSTDCYLHFLFLLVFQAQTYHQHDEASLIHLKTDGCVRSMTQRSM
ncbi:hypothetical protein Hdeb2414_s0018g00536361 [Helianthus debilis subsp. tardiflorus]